MTSTSCHGVSLGHVNPLRLCLQLRVTEEMKTPTSASIEVVVFHRFLRTFPPHKISVPTSLYGLSSFLV